MLNESYTDLVIKNDPVTASIIDLLEIKTSSNTDVILTEGRISSGLQKIKGNLLKNDGLIGQLSKAGRGIGQMIMAAIRGDGEKVKEIASKVKKEDILKFLLNLDFAYLHLVSPYVHLIDGITGWGIMEKIEHYLEKGKQGVTTLITKIKKSIEFIKNEITKVVDKIKVELYRQSLEKLEKELVQKEKELKQS